MAQYRLEKKVNITLDGVTKWKIIAVNHDLNALKQMCPRGWRIVDIESGKVVWEP